MKHSYFKLFGLSLIALGLNAHANAPTFKLTLNTRCGAQFCSTYASPFIENGLIYARAFDKFIYVIDQSTGKITKKYNTEFASDFEPIIYDGMLYASAWDMFAFDQQTTDLKFKKLEAAASTPVIYHGSLIFGARDEVIALDRWTGKEKWRLKYNNEYFSSPIISNGHVLIGSYSSSSGEAGVTGFYSINAESGKEEWANHGGYNYRATPCVINNTIYIGSEDNYFDAIDQETGKYKWSYSSEYSFANFTSSPYCDVNRVYVASTFVDSTLYAFDSDTGKIVWTFQVPYTGDITALREFKAAPTVHDHTIFIGNDDHYLYALQKETGKLKWRFEADGEIRSKPSVSNGVVYFTTLAGSLYAIDETTGLMDLEKRT